MQNHKITLIGTFAEVKTQIYDPALDPDGAIDHTAAWSYGPTLNKPRYYAPAVLLGDDIYVFGGTWSSTTAEVLGPGSSAWIYTANLDQGRTDAVAAVSNNKAYLIGGYTATWAADVDQFDPTYIMYTFKKN